MATYMGEITDTGFKGDYKKSDKIDWQAIQVLIASCFYGGRITDDRDRRLIEVYGK